MKASELRIGNWVFDEKKGEACTVDGISFNTNDILTEDSTYDEYCRIVKPIGIPLSEEWLIKFGFEKHSGGEYWPKESVHNEDSWLSINLEEKIMFLSGPDSATRGHCWEVDIPYVHTLQNAFFAAKSEELTIKEI